MKSTIAEILEGLKDGWQTQRFASSDMSAYARQINAGDARRGLRISGFVLFCVFIMDTVMFNRFGYAGQANYTFALLAVLALHIMVSARSVSDARTAYLLGTTMIIITGSAFVLLANTLGSFSVGLLASITLLLMIVPLVPWGLREASMVLGLIYLMFTGAVWTTDMQIDIQTWWSLQFIMLGTGIVSLALVWRNTLVRKADIRVRFQLEQAHREVMHLSNKDPLTGAWNRRYLNDAFVEQTRRWQESGLTYHFAFIDIDDFKAVNDGFGHDTGDWVLKVITDAFTSQLGSSGAVVRMGGDEFAILFVDDNPEQCVDAGLRRVHERIMRNPRSQLRNVGLSIGMVSVKPHDQPEQRDIYKQADLALYEAKRRKNAYKGEMNLVRLDSGACT